MNEDLFNSNQESILLLTEIVENFRKQNFYYFCKIVKTDKNTSSLSEFIFSGQCSEKILDEFQLVLPALMEVQRNGDYILQADILEGDL